jgi:hypothetical protein
LPDSSKRFALAQPVVAQSPSLGISYSAEIGPAISGIREFESLREWWENKRAGRAMPSRNEVDPHELREHLGLLVLAQGEGELTDFRFRLLGTKINEAFGRDSTGKSVCELFKDIAPDYCEYLVDVYRTVVARGTSARGRGNLQAVGREYRQFDSYILPLADHSGGAGWIISRMSFQ